MMATDKLLPGNDVGGDLIVSVDIDVAEYAVRRFD